MVDGLNSKTLIGNPVEKGVLSDGVRVSGQAKVLAGGSKSGTVIRGTELKSVGFGNLGTNDKIDGNKNRVVAPASRNNIKWEFKVMNMVNRVLDGRLHMDNEEEDVDDFKSPSEAYPVAEKDAWQNVIKEPASENKKVNAVGDKDAWQNEIGEPTSENKIGIKRTDNDNGSVMLGLNSPAEGSGLNGNQDSIPRETAPNVPLKRKRKYTARSGFLTPTSRGENDITEKEGNFYVSDLVWGKVNCHPWWPGQIFSPESASSEAAMHSKCGAYLIAYFGDRTFAWNNRIKIKPFGMYFSKMEKQSNSEKFCHAVQCALDESARRVEFGLSCPCLPSEVRDGIKFQVTENAGIMEIASRSAGGDVLSGAATFSPGDLLKDLESLARRPQSTPDRLQFTIEKAQVLAYNRWKGRYRLPVYEQHPCLWNANEEVEGLFPSPVYEADNGVSSMKRESTAVDGSCKRKKNLEGDEEEEEPELFSRLTKWKKVAQVPEKTAIYDDEKHVRGARNIISSGENHEMADTNSKGRRGRKPKNLFGPNGEPQTGEKIPVDILTPDLVRTKLSLLAKKPMQGYDAMTPVVGFLREFRKSACPQTLSQVNDATSPGEQQVTEIGNDVSSKKRESTGRDAFSGKRKKHSGNEKRPKIKEKYLSALMSPGGSSSGATDSQDQVLVKPDSDVPTVSKSDDKGKKPVVDLDPEGPSDSVGEAPKEDRPTAILLNFSKLDAIPAVPILNEIFTAYGPLIESATTIMPRAKRVKVVFKRRKDAETAFSSTGKYRTFGPALISYRLYIGIDPKKQSKKRPKKQPKKQPKKRNPR